MYGSPITFLPSTLSTSKTMKVRRRGRAPHEYALAELWEFGLPVVVERDKLTVENGRDRKLREEAYVGRHVPATTAAYTERAFGRHDRSEPVPFHFEGVAAARRQPAGAGEHRFGKGAIGRHRSSVDSTW
jgi:hypothetical protein